MEKEIEFEKPLSQIEAREFLGISRQTFYTWRRRGLIQAYTLGGKCYFLRSQLLKAITGSPVQSFRQYNKTSHK